MMRNALLLLFALFASAAHAEYHFYGPYASSSEAVAARTADGWTSCGIQATWHDSPFGMTYACGESVYVPNVGVDYYVYLFDSECFPGGRYGGVCAPSCSDNPSLAATDPACPTPSEPDCPAHQTRINDVCTPDTPEPNQGQSLPSQGVVSGTCQGEDNCTLDPNLTNGGSLPVNCGGWDCTANITNLSEPPNCYIVLPDTTTLYCDFNPVYTGNGKIESTSPTSPASGSSTSSAAVCPIGYSRIDGVCTAPGTGGTPAGLSGGGTQATPATTSCPVGYTLDSFGYCQSAAGQTSCPSGYTLVGGQCVSGTQTGTAATTPSGGGTCGGPGQVPCKIDLGDGAGILGYDFLSMEGLIPTFDVDIADLVPIDLGAPAAQCPAPVPLPKGLVWDWSPICSFAEWMNPIFIGLAWLSAGFIVVGGLPRD